MLPSPDLAGANAALTALVSTRDIIMQLYLPAS
jgi:hypothetical protein